MREKERWENKGGWKKGLRREKEDAKRGSNEYNRSQNQ